MLHKPSVLVTKALVDRQQDAYVLSMILSITESYLKTKRV